MGTGSFPGVKRLGIGVDLPSLSTAEIANSLELYLQPPSVSGVTFIFNLYSINTHNKLYVPSSGVHICVLSTQEYNNGHTRL